MTLCARLASVTDQRLRLALGLLLLAVYLLVYIPVPDSIDGSDTLDVARTLVLAGSPAATILSTPRQLIVSGAQGEQYLISPDGERYSKKGVAPSLLLLPLVALAEALPWLSIRATAMLLNPVLTALTGAALYTLLRQMAFGRGVALATGLVYGLATLAAVYPRTLFGEPLAALLLVLAVGGLYGRPAGDRRGRLLAGAAAGLAAGVNLSYAALLPVFGLLLRPRRDWRGLLWFGLPAALVLAGLALYNLARYGSLSESGYYLGSVEGFTTPLVDGLYGLWLSPYKGFFWYSPALLLALPGLALLWRRDRRLTAVVLLLTALQSIIYGTWWAWDGAWCWGPRFLLPVLPLLLLPVAAVLEVALRRRSLLLIVLPLVALSVAVQGLGAAYDYIPFYERLYRHDLYDPINQPLLAHLALLLLGTRPDVAWLAEGVDGVHALLALLLAAAGIALPWLPAAGPRGRATDAAALLLAIVVLNGVVARQQDNASQQLPRQLTAALNPPGPVLVASFQPGTALMDVETIPRLVVVNPHAPAGHPAVQAQIARVTAQAGFLWYLTWLPPAAADNWLERALWSQYALFQQTTVGDHRLLGFHTRPGPPAAQPGGWQFGPVTLAGYGLRQDDAGLFVTLAWARPVQPPAPDLTWFVHVLDAGGAIVAQQDRPPVGGFAPIMVSSGPAGEVVTDRLFFPLALEPGWRLRVGVVVAGQPVPVSSPQGVPLAEPFLLLPP
ncbi:MAG: hypothetical protein MUE40_07180 [Anaerolineae bacterium]|nr:hypothetical protein [Anaerolineae bacterium]